MPDKPLTVITYAASASLAAAALFYFFTPSNNFDGPSAPSQAKMRQKKGVVGLANPANDCFINSILQALAGLRDLRLYLIRELHRRKLDESVYKSVPKEKAGKEADVRLALRLQNGDVTKGLKEILDRLNEKPSQKTTISAGAFISCLERSFETRISKTQQDAQEMLQVIAERVSDEYRAGRDARRRAKKHERSGSAPAVAVPDEPLVQAASLAPAEEKDPARSSSLNEEAINATKAAEEEEVGFPLEGRTESSIECMHCHFVPKSKPTTFVNLTLPVPQKSHVSLDTCFDSYLKVEYIDDYKCDRCRLQHAIETYEKSLKREKSPKSMATLEDKIAKLKAAIETDPEQPPPDVELPHSKLAPTRRIARSVRIVDFPQVLVVHLSRSIYDSNASSKNMAKVSFGESLALGGLQHRRKYRLLGIVSHKGQHNSGHYETFRRQEVLPPISHPHLNGESGLFSRSHTPVRASASSPQPQLQPLVDSDPDHAAAAITTTSGAPSPEPSNSTVTSPDSSKDRASFRVRTDSSAMSLDAPYSPPSASTTTPSSALSSATLSTQPSAHSLVANSKPAPPQLTTTPAPARPNGNDTAQIGEAKRTSDPHTRSVRSPEPTDPAAADMRSRSTSPVSPKRPSAHPPAVPSPPLRRSARIQDERRSSTSSTKHGGTADRLRADTHQTRSRSLSLVAGRHIRGGRSSRRQPEEKWWRMSDEKVKECKTSDVLGMQKEVYLLFYEMERD